MFDLPVYVAPERFTDPRAALEQARHIYDTSVRHLREAMLRHVSGQPGGPLERRVRAHYPMVRVQTDSALRHDIPAAHAALSYGFVAGPGRFETTLTRPDLFGDYYREQFELLLENHGVEPVSYTHLTLPTICSV